VSTRVDISRRSATSGTRGATSCPDITCRTICCISDVSKVTATAFQQQSITSLQYLAAPADHAVTWRG